MAKDAITAVVFFTLATTVRCQRTSQDTTKANERTEATTINFIDDPTGAGRFFQSEPIKSGAQFLNGSLCQHAYSCHSASDSAAAANLPGCSCSDYCSIYGDCCSDKVSILTSSELKRLQSASFTCGPHYVFHHSVYMITNCPASYEDQSIAGNCTNVTDFSQPAMDIRWTPATDVVTGVTFRNVYCATCWGKTRRNVALWLWKLTCPEAVHESKASVTESPSIASPSANGSGLSRENSAIKFIRSACKLSFEPPVLNASLHFCKDDAIADCGNASSRGNVDGSLISACLKGPAGYVYDEWGLAYWNVECARCRLWPNEPTLSCQPSKVDNIIGGVPSLSLAILLTPDSNDCTAATKSLLSNSGWTPDSLCRGLLDCQSDGSSSPVPGCKSKGPLPCAGAAARLSGSDVGSACTASDNESLSLCTFMDSPLSADTVAKTRSTVWLNVTVYGSAVLAVTLTDNTTLCYLCTADRYESYSVSNQSLVVNSSSGAVRRSFSYPMYVVKESVATVCTAIVPLHGRSNMSVEDGCSAVPAFVSTLFLCLSDVALIVFFASFARVKALRRFPGEMVLNEAVAFFLAFSFFLVRPLLGSVPAACTAVGVLIHYFLLAAFLWTALYSSEVARALSFRVSEGPSKRRRVTHYCLAWGTPLVCVAIGLGADRNDLEFRPLYGPPQCFIGNRLGNLTLFMAPLCIFLAVDVIVYIFMIVKLAVIARQTKAVRSSHNEKLWLSIKLVLSMGLLWLFAVLASFTQSAALYCVFSLVNSLQGVFLMAVFVCKRDILKALARKSKTLTTDAALSSGTKSTNSTVS